MLANYELVARWTMASSKCLKHKNHAITAIEVKKPVNYARILEPLSLHTISNAEILKCILMNILFKMHQADQT